MLPTGARLHCMAPLTCEAAVRSTASRLLNVASVRVWRGYGGCGAVQRKVAKGCRGFATGQQYVEDEVPVLVVGAGPVGVYLSHLLTKRFGIATMVAERWPRRRTDAVEGQPLPHPKAHVLHTRSMELFREIGLEDHIREASPPLDQWKHFRYCTSLIGKEIAALDHCDDKDGAFSNLKGNSPTFVTHLSQPKLEDILWAEIDKASGSVRPEFLHEHEIESLADRGDHVEAILQPTRGKGTAKRRVRCQYLVGADGSRSEVRRLLGIECEGARGIENFVSVHFKCEGLYERMRGRGAMLYFVFNPDLIACVVAHDLEAGEWVLQAPFFPPLQQGQLEPPALHALIAACIAGPPFPPGSVEGLPLSSCRPSPPADRRAEAGARGSEGSKGWCEGLEWELCSARPWSMDATVAGRLREGRVLLVGDAAHQLPPSGGFGLNLGLQDAHNAAWKLATAARRAEEGDGEGAEALLESFHSERHPVAVECVALARRNHQRGLQVPSSIGLSPDLLHSLSAPLTRGPLAAALPLAARQQALEALLEVGRSPLFLLEAPHTAQAPDALRVSLNRLKAAVLGGPLEQRMAEQVLARRSIPMLFPHNDLGLAYPPGPAVHGPSAFESALRRDGAELYLPSALAGARLPHAWLRRPASPHRASTLDLVAHLAAAAPRPRWVLMVAAGGEGDAAWGAWGRLREAWGREDARARAQVAAVRVRPPEGGEPAEEEDWVDEEGGWRRVCGLGEGGAVLVRPDGHVAYRSPAAPDHTTLPALLALSRSCF